MTILGALQDKFGNDVDIVDKNTIKKEYGWAVFYNTQAFIDTGDPMVGLMSNNPILCLWDGRMLPLAMNCTVEEAIRKLESEMSLI
jgi:hypothetical protein